MLPAERGRGERVAGPHNLGLAPSGNGALGDLQANTLRSTFIQKQETHRQPMRESRWGDLARYITLVLLALLVLSGCPPSPLNPSITVTVGSGALTINGMGFNSTASPCATLSLQGLPQPYSNIGIGQATCTGGTFSPAVVWNYYYVGNNCVFNQSVSATVFAIDTQGTNAGTSKTISLPWGSNCGISTNYNCASCNDGSCQCGYQTSNALCSSHNGVNPALGCVQEGSRRLP
jgi:hypothetical protein